MIYLGEKGPAEMAAQAVAELEAECRVLVNLPGEIRRLAPARLTPTGQPLRLLPGARP